MNYNDKTFRPVSTTENGETSAETIFHYRQNGNMLTCEYSGGKIIHGHLIGLVDKAGNINMRYHPVNSQGELMTGICQSTPETLENGKILLHKSWQWTSADGSKGESVLEQVCRMGWMSGDQSTLFLELRISYVAFIINLESPKSASYGQEKI